MTKPDWILKNQQRSKVEDITNIADAVNEGTIQRVNTDTIQHPYKVDNHGYWNEIYTLAYHKTNIICIKAFPSCAGIARFLKPKIYLM